MGRPTLCVKRKQTLSELKSSDCMAVSFTVDQDATIYSYEPLLRKMLQVHHGSHALQDQTLLALIVSQVHTFRAITQAPLYFAS